VRCLAIWQTGTGILEGHVASTFFYPEEGSSRFFWNVGTNLPYYIVSHLQNTIIFNLMSPIFSVCYSYSRFGETLAMALRCAVALLLEQGLGEVSGAQCLKCHG
jgi:hypothetical protein